MSIIIFGFVVDYILARLTYHFYNYELGEEALRIERGIIEKRQIFIPYERIQNVDIYRGIFERMLGLSEISIQTAGYGITTEAMGAEGKLPGLSVEDAEKLREELLQKVKGAKLEV